MQSVNSLFIILRTEDEYKYARYVFCEQYGRNVITLNFDTIPICVTNAHDSISGH